MRVQLPDKKQGRGLSVLRLDYLAGNWQHVTEYAMNVLILVPLQWPDLFIFLDPPNLPAV